MQSQPKRRHVTEKCPNMVRYGHHQTRKNELDCIGMWDEDNPLNIFNVARTHIPSVNQEYEQRQGVK
nr:hypothetical protein [uncultured Methanolobus sp.]